MQGWVFQVSPVISGAKDLISPAFSNAKRKKPRSRKRREQREIFFLVFLWDWQTLGNCLKKTSWNENFFIRKVKATYFYHLCVSFPTGVGSSPMSFSCSSRKASREDRHLAWVQLTLASSPVAPRKLSQPRAPCPAASCGWPAGTGGQQSSVELHTGGQSLPGTVALGIALSLPRARQPGVTSGPGEVWERAEGRLLRDRLCNRCSHLHKFGEKIVCWDDNTEVRNWSKLWDDGRKPKLFSKAGRCSRRAEETRMCKPSIASYRFALC